LEVGPFFASRVRRGRGENRGMCGEEWVVVVKSVGLEWWVDMQLGERANELWSKRSKLL
jgi:hypothetical protein